MRRLPSLVIASALLFACDPSGPATAPSASAPALAGAVSTFHQRIPVVFDETRFVDCAQESIAFHVDELFIRNEVAREGEWFHGHLTFLDRGTRGIGLISGATYHQVGAQKDNIHIRANPSFVETFTNTLDLIGEGKAPNLKLHQVFHLTVTPRGRISVVVDRVRVVCR